MVSRALLATVAALAMSACSFDTGGLPADDSDIDAATVIDAPAAADAAGRIDAAGGIDAAAAIDAAGTIDAAGAIDAPGAPDAAPAPDGGIIVAGSALDFDGDNDRVGVDREIQDDFTIEAWIKTTASRDGSAFYHGLGLVYADTVGVDDDFGTSILNEHFAFGVGNPDTTIESTTAVTTGDWVHVAVTRDRSTGTIRLYVNGVEEATTTTANTDALDATSTITIGGNTINGRYFDGVIDEVRVWSIERTQPEIAATMNISLTGNWGGLVGYWRFDDGAGGTATDSSPSGNDGNLGQGGIFADPTWVSSDAPIF